MDLRPGRPDLVVELYSLESSVYSGCPDSTRRDPRKAIDAIQRAIALDSSRGGARGSTMCSRARFVGILRFLRRDV